MRRVKHNVMTVCAISSNIFVLFSGPVLYSVPPLGPASVVRLRLPQIQPVLHHAQLNLLLFPFQRFLQEGLRSEGGAQKIRARFSTKEYHRTIQERILISLHKSISFMRLFPQAGTGTADYEYLEVFIPSQTSLIFAQIRSFLSV